MRAEPKSFCFGKFGMRLYSCQEQTPSRSRALRMEARQGWRGVEEAEQRCRTGTAEPSLARAQHTGHECLGQDREGG